MKIYHDILRQVIELGDTKADRTGTGTTSLFGIPQIHHDLANGFPLLTTKRVHWKSVVEELLWFLRGETNIRPLLSKNVHIWSDWPHASYCKANAENIPLSDFENRILADPDFSRKWGDLGPVYGAQWRRWPGADGKTIDQIAQVIDMLRNQPASRRIVLSAWNVTELSSMALAPCHCLVQFAVSNGRLHCKLYQRSADSFLGVPFNIASYALLTTMLAQVCKLQPGMFIHTFGDLHIYSNHMEQVEELLSRTPRELPRVVLNPAVKEIDNFCAQDITLLGYDPWPAIKALVAV